jgi:hypothetical protein
MSSSTAVRTGPGSLSEWLRLNPAGRQPISSGDYPILGVRTPAKGSRRFPIQSIDFLGACIAQQKRRIVGSQAHPDTESAGLPEVC